MRINVQTLTFPVYQRFQPPPGWGRDIKVLILMGRLCSGEERGDSMPVMDGGSCDAETAAIQNNARCSA